VSRIESVAPTGISGTAPPGQVNGAAAASDFARVLGETGEAAGIKFSKHALERISARGLAFNQASIAKLDAAISAAQVKGANESLVLMDELALVVSVKNRTVITAMSSREPDHNVFTSIDSAVIA
jgi:flagellar operon protein